MGLLNETKYPGIADKLAGERPEIVHLLQSVPTLYDAATALRCAENTISGWLSGAHPPSAKYEMRAREVLGNASPVASAPVPAAQSGTVLLAVVVSAADASKARKLLAMIGAQVEEI